MRTVDIEVVDALDLGVLVHASVAPSDADWKDTMETWGRFGQGVRANGRQPSCLVVSRAGEGPNATQRRVLDGINASMRPRVAVATSSSLTRGIVTAISWFGHTEIEAFLAHDLDGALAFLRVDASRRARVDEAIAAANVRLRVSNTGT